MDLLGVFRFKCCSFWQFKLLDFIKLKLFRGVFWWRSFLTPFCWGVRVRQDISLLIVDWCTCALPFSNSCLLYQCFNMTLYLRSLGVVVGENSNSLWGTNIDLLLVLNGRKQVPNSLEIFKALSKCHWIVALKINMFVPLLLNYSWLTLSLQYYSLKTELLLSAVSN